MDIYKFILEEWSNPEVDPEALTKSMEDTQMHIDKVGSRMAEIREKLSRREELHDSSKLKSPEKEMFAYYGPILSKLKYGSDEYKENLDKMGYALKHHYQYNTHHPEHFKNGIDDMSLLDIIEMLSDWRASCDRTKNGNILESLEINAKRFNINPQLKSILKNTIKELYWE